MITDVFNLILQLKNIKKVKYNLTDEDKFIIKSYYKAYKLNKIIGYKIYMNTVIDFSIKTLSSPHKCCELLSKAIVEDFEYKVKNNKY